MVRNTRQMGSWIVIAVAIGLVSSLSAFAKKPPKPGDEPAYQYTLVDLLGFENGDLGYQSVAQFVGNRDGEEAVLVYGTSFRRYEDGSYQQNPATWQVHADGTFAEPEDHGQPTFAGGADPMGFNSLGVGVGWTRFGIEQDENGNWVFPSYVDIPGLGYREMPGVVDRNTDANAINDWGAIVGVMMIEDAASPTGFWSVGCLWQLDGNLIPGDPVSLGDFLPMDINNHGVMAGRAMTGYPAIAWFEGETLLVQVMDTDDLRYKWGDVNALNDSPVGDSRLTVVGEAEEDGAGEAFAWRPFDSANSTTLLGRFDRGYASAALDVNVHGEIVGWSDTKREGKQAFLYVNGVLANLNDLVDTGGKRLGRAWGINDDGDIVGSLGIPRPVSEQHGFLLRPIETTD